MNSKKSKKKICLIFCGGTIAMLPNKKTGALEPAKSAKELLSLVPKVREIADVDIVELFNIDSTDITLMHWNQIAKEIYKRYHQYDGFLVTHGTDTMADTGSALAFAFGKNLNKPIVLTGAQSYPEAIGTDAKFNLENAFRVVISDTAEVMISFGHYVYRAVRAQKKHESDFNAFMSPAFPELAYIRGNIQWTFLAKRKTESNIPEIDFKPDFESEILTIKLNAAITPEMIDTLIGSHLIRALLFESLGAGNIPGRYLPVVKKAVKLNLPVLIASPFIGGSTATASTYKLGLDALKAGVIATNDMTFTAAYVKLMWCLAQVKKKIKAKELKEENIILIVKKMFQTDYTGEVTLNDAKI